MLGIVSSSVVWPGALVSSLAMAHGSRVEDSAKLPLNVAVPVLLPGTGSLVPDGGLAVALLVIFIISTVCGNGTGNSPVRR